MVIRNDPDYKKKKAAEERLNKGEVAKKEEFLAELRKERVDILCLALMYAKNFEETGEDITKRLITADKNVDLLQAVYNKGYREGLAKGKELKNGRQG